MGLFDGLMTKKNCAICGKELGVFGKTKLGDGSYLCRDCSDKLSPYYTGYGQATIDDINEQLAYREENAEKVAAFNVTQAVDGGGKTLYVDEDAGNIILTSVANWRQSNPDVIAFSQVGGSEIEVRELKSEIKRKTSDGKEVSYNPPRYDIDYDIYIKVFVSSPYFSSISWKVNKSTIETKGSTQYREAMSKAEAVKAALSGHRQEARAAAAPKAAVNCPYCGATTVPDASGCCEYCGSALR